MDEAQNQSALEEATLGTGGAGENEAPAHEGGAGSEPKPAAWTNQLSKELKADSAALSRIANFGTITDLVRDYLKKAEEGADFTDVKAVLEKIGLPKEGEPYELGVELEGELAKFEELARGAMLTKEQASKVLEGYQALMRERILANVEAAKAANKELTGALTKEFGAAAAEYYRKGCAGRNLGKTLTEAGLGADKDLARALCLLGREMSEDAVPQSGKQASGGGFKSVKDGGSFYQ